MSRRHPRQVGLGQPGRAVAERAGLVAVGRLIRAQQAVVASQRDPVELAEALHQVLRDRLGGRIGSAATISSLVIPSATRLGDGRVLVAASRPLIPPCAWSSSSAGTEPGFPFVHPLQMQSSVVVGSVIAR